MNFHQNILHYLRRKKIMIILIIIFRESYHFIMGIKILYFP